MPIQSDSFLSPGLFDGRRAIVTGGGSGIGAALVRIIAARGARVAIFDRNAEAAERVAGEIGPRASWYAVDVSDESAVTTAVQAAAGRLNGIDALVNVAGLVLNGGLADAEMSELLNVLGINLLGPLYVCRAAFPYLRGEKQAAVVNIASMAATQAYPGGGLYGASKAGLVAMSNQMAIEWAPFGIRVNVVSPGQIDTPLANGHGEAARAERTKRIPLGRRGTPEEVAEVIAFLLTAGASYMTAEQVIVGGGLAQTVMGGRSWWLEHLAVM